MVRCKLPLISKALLGRTPIAYGLNVLNGISSPSLVIPGGSLALLRHCNAKVKPPLLLIIRNSSQNYSHLFYNIHGHFQNIHGDLRHLAFDKSLVTIAAPSNIRVSIVRRQHLSNHLEILLVTTGDFESEKEDHLFSLYSLWD